ncbi:Non-histone chromosomal protein 6 [Neolecta irregularis DAH-3]|uniref:Non-histone chromosomal protein 6 n=1 Tax=Neolecta irregularis (strain DAH-3) TaxID=1198029 RepID=A0A1U7LKE7_NEOID|nr:Non-histone chromosomal protein 6 [Neolecta irregularis DAH-3]|eukprot:OLL23130.1 Non-histone chromosomal protein 6 [Neolecta irregularis DAH-3]
MSNLEEKRKAVVEQIELLSRVCTSAARAFQDYATSLSDSTVKDSEPAKGESPPEPEKKERKKKDPNAPKAAKNAYLLFCDLHRPVVQKELANSGDQKTVMSRLGAMWKETSEDDRKPWEAKAEEEKAKHVQEMKLYAKGEFIRPDEPKKTTPVAATETKKNTPKSSSKSKAGGFTAINKDGKDDDSAAAAAIGGKPAKESSPEKKRKKINKAQEETTTVSPTIEKREKKKRRKSEGTKE